MKLQTALPLVQPKRCSRSGKALLPPGSAFIEFVRYGGDYSGRSR